MRVAREAAERLSLGPTLALLDLDEARILARRNAPGDADAACRLLADARRRSDALGVPVIGDQLERVEQQVGAGAGPAPAADAPAGAGATPIPAAAPGASLRREGDVWRIGYEGRTLYVKDAKGLRHLALLLGHPGVELHAVDIVGASEGGPDAASRGGPAAAGEDLQARPAGDGDAGALLDPQAKREYRTRLEDLRADIEEAEAFNDPERAARAREEMEFIARELSSAVGLGGRDRRAASNAERARVNVTRAVRGAIRRIAAEDASLGRELETTVHTGYFCRYEPDPRHPVTWHVDGG
jgi:non-specific serine/threonine protein kinase